MKKKVCASLTSCITYSWKSAVGDCTYVAAYKHDIVSHETRSESLAVGGLTWLFDSLQSYGSYLKERLLLDVQAQITSESFWATFFSHTTALEVLRMWKMPHNVHHFSYCRLMKQHEASFFGRHIHKCKMLIKSSQISILTFRQKEGRSWLDVRYHRKKKKSAFTSGNDTLKYVSLKIMPQILSFILGMGRRT